MSDARIPGPIGAHGNPISGDVFQGDIGAHQCRFKLKPGVVGYGNGVANMPLEDRFSNVLSRTLSKLPAELQEEFAMLLSPASLAIVVGTMVIWAGSHYFGVGFIVDALLLVAGFGFLGWQVWTVGGDFVSCIQITCSAQSEDDLDRAAKHLANFIAVVGVAAFMALITKGAKRYGPRVKNLRGVIKAASAADAGMPNSHFQVFLRVAANPRMPRIIMVRQTNSKSVQWIRKGFPAKPKEIKMNTSKKTGIVTCKDVDEITKARKTTKAGSDKQYYTVDEHGRTATNGRGDTIDLADADWPVEPRQIIDPVAKKPLTGDYDLMGVIDPNAKGRTIALAVDNNANARRGLAPGTLTDDFTNTDIKKVAAQINSRLDQDRVLHGSHEFFDSIPNLKPDEVVVGFFPDGNVLSFNRKGLETFYQSIGRSTLDLVQFMQPK